MTYNVETFRHPVSGKVYVSLDTLRDLMARNDDLTVPQRNVLRKVIDDARRITSESRAQFF